MSVWDKLRSVVAPEKERNDPKRLLPLAGHPVSAGESRHSDSDKTDLTPRLNITISAPSLATNPESQIKGDTCFPIFPKDNFPSLRPSQAQLGQPQCRHTQQTVKHEDQMAVNSQL